MNTNHYRWKMERTMQKNSYGRKPMMDDRKKIFSARTNRLDMTSLNHDVGATTGIGNEI